MPEKLEKKMIDRRSIVAFFFPKKKKIENRDRYFWQTDWRKFTTQTNRPPLQIALILRTRTPAALQPQPAPCSLDSTNRVTRCSFGHLLASPQVSQPSPESIGAHLLSFTMICTCCIVFLNAAHSLRLYSSSYRPLFATIYRAIMTIPRMT